MTLPQALEAACLANDVEKVQILLGDFQYQRDIVTSVLHLACEKNLAGIIRLVLTVSSAADVKRLLETTNKSDNNPIHIACRHGALEAVKVLVEEGQDLPNRTSLVAREGGGKSSKTSVTPLHAACVGGNLALVQYLAGFNGVSLESRCSDGTSCMHLACVADALDIVKFLAVKAPSLMQAKSAQAFTPLTTCAGFLAAKCAPFVLEKTKPHKEDELFDLLILALRSTVAQKTNEDARCDTLRAILSYVEEGRVKAFVNRPVKDHPRKGLEERPVHIAAREGRVDPLFVLISHGADIAAKSSQGLRALDVCLQYTSENHKMCVELLVAKWERLRLDAEENMMDLLCDELIQEEKKAAPKRVKKKRGKKKGKHSKRVENKLVDEVKNSPDEVNNIEMEVSDEGHHSGRNDPLQVEEVVRSSVEQVVLTQVDQVKPEETRESKTDSQVERDERRKNAKKTVAESTAVQHKEPSKESQLDDEKVLSTPKEGRPVKTVVERIVRPLDLPRLPIAPTPVASREPQMPKSSPVLLEKAGIQNYFRETMDSLHLQALPLGLTVFNVLGEDTDNLSAGQLEVLQEILQSLSNRVMRMRLQVAHASGREEGEVVAQRALELYVQDKKNQDTE